MLPIIVMVLGMVAIFIINSLFMKRNQLQIRAKRIDVYLTDFTTVLREELGERSAEIAAYPELQALLAEQTAAPTPGGCRDLNAMLKNLEPFQDSAAALQGLAKELATECELYDQQVVVYNRAISNPPGCWFRAMLKLTPFQRAYDR